MPLFKALIAEHDKNNERARMTVLNHAIPPQRYLAQILNSSQLIETKVISGFNGYKDYYQKVIEYFPNSADAYAMRGFCDYKLGRIPEAILWYQKAKHLSPDFFWHYYNLGVLYFIQGQYAEAVGEFKKGLDLKLENTIQETYQSKVYQQIFNAYGKDYNIPQELKKGYYKSSLLMSLGYAYLSDQKKSQEVQNIFQKIGGNVQVF